MINVTSLRDEIAKQRSTTAQSEFGPIPASIPYLQGLLTDSLSLDERHLVFAAILSECSRAKNDHLELHFLRRQVSALPKQPVLLVSLALGLAKFPELRDDAIQTGLDAVRVARQQDRQLRYSLTALARLALSLNEYTALELALTELIADQSSNRDEDTGYEFDFVDAIDTHRIAPSLLDAYKGLRS